MDIHTRPWTSPQNADTAGPAFLLHQEIGRAEATLGTTAFSSTLNSEGAEERPGRRFQALSRAHGRPSFPEAPDTEAPPLDRPMMPTSLVLLPGMDGTGELFDPLLAVKSPFGRHHLQGLAGEGGGEAEGYVEELGGSGEAGGVGGARPRLNNALYFNGGLPMLR